MHKRRILVVDDEPGMLEVCADTLRRLPDTEVLLENQSVRAAERLGIEKVDLVILDIRMPGLNGIELLGLAREHDPSLAALMLTAYPTLDTAVECMRLGAADYLSKPFLPADLLSTVKRLLESKRLRDENQWLRRQVERSYNFGQIIGQSDAMRQVRREIAQLAEADVDVLILGETGTGKELAARAIHYASRRAATPFVPVNCGAIPDDLLEGEFFGHERGAYTGAQARSLGLLEFADKGTFFLDEISQLPLPLQPKLLRVLQERTVRRLGATEEVKLDVRIVAASSLDLEGEMRAGRFRPDLYHRINVGMIVVPPLRNRSDDIPLLADYFLDQFARELHRSAPTLSPEALGALARYAWPGNVRQLQNILKRALVMAQHEPIELDDLPDDIVAWAVQMGARGESAGYFAARNRRLISFEREYLRVLLERHNGDTETAASEAHLPRGTLYRLMKRHALGSNQFRS